MGVVCNTDLTWQLNLCCRLPALDNGLLSETTFHVGKGIVVLDRFDYIDDISFLMQMVKGAVFGSHGVSWCINMYHMMYQILSRNCRKYPTCMLAEVKS